MPVAAWIWVVMSANPPLIPEPYENALVYRLSVTPAAVPARKLQYELLPPRRERTPGNAAVEYLRAATQLPKEPRREPEESQAHYDMLERWRTASLGRLPVEDVKHHLKAYDKAMAAADLAARFEKCDWQYPPPGLKSVFKSDLQPQREIIQWLRLRVRLELAEGRHDAALRTIQTSLQMARHVGNAGVLIDSLVGVAFAAITLQAIADHGSVPGTPNLYWALAALPDPFLDLRAVMAGEREFLPNTFPGFVEFEKGPVSERRAWEIVESMRKDLQLMSDASAWFTEKPAKPENVNEIIGSALGFVLSQQSTEFEKRVRNYSEDFAAVARAPAARKWLRERGVRDTDKMPHLQATYLAAWMRSRDCFDEMASAFLLPTHKAIAQTRLAAAANKKALEESRNDPIARELLLFSPAIEKVFAAHVRLRRQFAAVQAVEALRAHLAVAGRFPKSWAEVTVVPVPNDPLTGKPFEYKFEYEKATITAPPPAGETPSKSNNLRYVISVRNVK